jgi:hypothetical protein
MIRSFLTFLEVSLMVCPGSPSAFWSVVCIILGNLLRSILFTFCNRFLLYSCILSKTRVTFSSFASWRHKRKGPQNYIIKLSIKPGVSSGAVGWGTALQAGMTRVWLFIHIILPVALWSRGWTQPPIEMSTRNISWGWRRPVRRADNLTTFMCRLSWNLGVSTSWNPQGLSRPAMGLLYLTLFTLKQCYMFRPSMVHPQ